MVWGEVVETAGERFLKILVNGVWGWVRIGQEMGIDSKPLLSGEEYLEILLRSDVRYEYWDGEVVGMAGASDRHNLICASILSNLWAQLLKTDCKPVGSDQLIRKREANKYVFADVVVRCKNAGMEVGVVPALHDPVVVFEVLSPATEAVDRGKKFAYYSSFESLRELVLVSQQEKLVEHFYRETPGEAWRVEHLMGDDEDLRLESVGAVLGVGIIYEAVEWESEG